MKADDTANVIAFASAVAAVGSVGITAWALVVARKARRDSRDSAVASQRSAEAAEQTARLDAHRRHEELSPPAPDAVEVTSVRDHSGRSLFGRFTVGRVYEVRASAGRRGQGDHSVQVVTAEVARPGEVNGFRVRLPDGAAGDLVNEVRFEFWPMASGPGSWTCPCGAPVAATEGHWSWPARLLRV